VNPGSAAYCFYDGRALGEAGQQGPVGLGTRPFSLPFSFSDGHGCANFNQLVLACDRRWNEARANLQNGTWESFFSTIGRADLAVLARHAAKENDADLGLSRFLEGLPADPEALRPPKLALTTPVEDLGALEPGKDHKFQLVIENQGVLLMSGTVVTDCDWLYFGDRVGNSSAKLFQTRDSYSLAVRIPGHVLRAGKKPLEGQILIDTNGGRQAVTVRATVPARPFPAGQDGKNVLAGAGSPRELAVKARTHPKEAAALFEQGAVKAWYESNGWTYPIQGTQARGKGALQQFFEALGLTKPPRLEISTEKIECRGEAGKKLTKNVVISSTEPRFVHAEGHSSQSWIKVLPGKSQQGNSLTISLSIEVPPRPGETLAATVTIYGNGRQRFDVAVALTVTGTAPKRRAEREEEPPPRRLLPWIAAAVGLCLLLVIGGAVALNLGQSDDEDGDNQSRDKKAELDKKTDLDRKTDGEKPVKSEAWWAKIPDSKLGALTAKLEETAGANKPIFASVAAQAEDERRKGYEQLAEKLPELARNPAARKPLGEFFTEICVFEPSDFNLSPLLRGLDAQFPAEDREFPAGDRGEGVERAVFWLGVVCDAINHKAAGPDRRRDLTSELSKLLGFDPDTPPAEIRDRAEKSLAELCYHNTPPTAEKSVEQALAVRDALLARFPKHLPPEFREQDDVKLLAVALPRGGEQWPKLKPIYESCADSCARSKDLNKVLNVGNKLTALYAKANEDLAPKLEEVLAARWKVPGVSKLPHAEKVASFRARMERDARSRLISDAERVKKLQLLVTNGPRNPGKPLLETVRMAHASTMASLLLSKDAARFDELITSIPALDQGKPPDEEKNPEDRPRLPGAAEVIHVGNGTRVVRGEFTDKTDLDPRRGAHRKEYLVPLKAQQIYHIYMKSDALTPYIRLESGAGKQLVADKGPTAHITYVPQAEGDYRLIASSTEKGATGQFIVQVSLQRQVIRFGGRRPHFQVPLGQIPGMPDQGQGQDPGENKTQQVNLRDLADIASNRTSEVRTRAFRNLAGNVPNELVYRHAARIADYLLATTWNEAERNAATEALPSLAGCRHLLQALADGIAAAPKLEPQRTVAVVGALIRQPDLRFDRDEDWRAGCRKLLLKRALELTGRGGAATNDADQAAELLRDLYKEQGLALGLDAPDFEEQTELAQVLARLIKHVAGRAARQELAPADKTWLEGIDRELQAAQFAAANDLEHVVLLQRLWVRVLSVAVQGQTAEANRKLVREVPRELDRKDRQAGGLLDQVKSGEEAVLRVWALAHDLKLK
jgi:hypothetical protein